MIDQIEWSNTTTGNDTGVIEAFAITDDEPHHNMDENAHEGTAGARYMQRWRRTSRSIKLILRAATIGGERYDSSSLGDTFGGRLIPTERYEKETWQAQNARRGELLLKSLDRDLSLDELREFNTLQSSAEAKINSLASGAMSALVSLPSPPDDMIEIIEPPLFNE